MSKINNHLVSFNQWKEWTNYEDYIFEDEKEVNFYDVYKDTPSKEECDRICAKFSREVIVYKVK